MKIILIAIECLDYRSLISCNAKNIKSLDPHPALSWGATSRASIACMLSLVLPECIYKDCYHNKMRDLLANPFFLTNLKRKNIPTFLYCANGWGMELIQPFTPKDVWELLIKQNREGFDDKELIEDFLSRDPEKLENYFAYFHLMTTHPPFFDGNRGDPIHWDRSKRKRAIEYVDKIIKPLLELDALIIVTSDHNIDHHTHHERILDVFIATKNHEKVMKDVCRR